MNSQENWQVEVKGQIYETNLTEIIEWIGDGAVLPDDKVRKGNLRWLQAGKIPELYRYFNGKFIETKSPVQTASIDITKTQKISETVAATVSPVKLSASESYKAQSLEFESLKKEKALQVAEPKKAKASNANRDVCSIHPEVPAHYVCKECTRSFCKTCPNSYGGVKLCPECGELCGALEEEAVAESTGFFKEFFAGNAKKNKIVENSIDNFEQNSASRSEQNSVYKVEENSANKVKPNSRAVKTNGKFGLADFGRAMIYPFNFKVSLIVGAVMFTLLMVGQSISGFGISMYFAAIVCLMLANTLIFGALANTLDNFSRGKTDADFMPGFDDFNLWDDVIHPFLLSFGVYLISFGLLFALITGAIWYASGSESKIESDKQKILSTIFPPMQNADSNGQVSQSNQLSAQVNSNGEKQTANASTESEIAQLQQNTLKQTTELEQLQSEINLSLQAQKQTDTEANAETEKGVFNLTTGTILRLSLGFSVPIFLTLLWGIFYFPVACAVAGYTRNLAAILNPAVGFDTIKRLGSDYFKVVGIFIILTGLAFGLNAILQFAFSSLNLPLLGNLPIRIFLGLFVFYLSIVFSVALGTMLFKNSKKLDFRHA